MRIEEKHRAWGMEHGIMPLEVGGALRLGLEAKGQTTEDRRKKVTRN